jgi:hypothetical protein
VVEICMNHVHMPPPHPSDRLGRPVSPDLQAALLKGLEKKPDDRFATAREFAEALLACTAARAWTNREAAAWWTANAPDGAMSPGGPTTGSVHQEPTMVMAGGMFK